MNVLAIETATDVCSVALSKGGKVTAECTIHRPRAHAENLVILVRDVLEYGQLDRKDLTAVAVSMGPGSYTGLRIGVSAAKGLALALGCTLLGVPTLNAVAAQAAVLAAPGDTVLALLNSRRGEVYAAAFRVGSGGALEAASETAALPVEALKEWIGEKVQNTLWVVGEGIAAAGDGLREMQEIRVRLLDPASHFPSARWIAALAHPRLEKGEAEDIAAFEPAYLKDFVAKKREKTIFERLPF